jgi:hypothetical protein
MPSFNLYVVKSVIDDEYRTVVETGTYKGTSALRLAEHFERVFTIEIDETLHQKASNRFANKDKQNIVALHGDSRDILPSLVPELCIGDKVHDKVIFWLDAHWSGDESVDWENSKWKGYGSNTGFSGKEKGDNAVAIPSSRQQVPLEEEIMCIYDAFQNECLIYIDDFDKIDPETKIGRKDEKFVGEDWSHLNFNKILDQIDSRTVMVRNLGTTRLLFKLQVLLQVI